MRRLKYYFFFSSPCSLCVLSSPTRDWTPGPAVKVWSPNYWTARESPLSGIFALYSHFQRDLANCLFLWVYTLKKIKWHLSHISDSIKVTLSPVQMIISSPIPKKRPVFKTILIGKFRHKASTVLHFKTQKKKCWEYSGWISIRRQYKIYYHLYFLFFFFKVSS